MRNKVRRSGFILILALSVFPFHFAQAQDYPTKPVTLVIPVGAGGSHDLTARAVTSVAADYLGQPIIIQLKPGGGGAIGSDLVSKAAPDGYTLLFGGPGWSSILPPWKAAPGVPMILPPSAGSITVPPCLLPDRTHPTNLSKR